MTDEQRIAADSARPTPPRPRRRRSVRRPPRQARRAARGRPAAVRRPLGRHRARGPTRGRATPSSRPARRPTTSSASPADSSPSATRARSPSSSSATPPATCSSSAASTSSAKRRSSRVKDLDLGDWVGAVGTVLRTRRGELSVAPTEVTLLSKSLRPLPEKYHGLSDTETRYRQRYVDLIANPEVRDVFTTRFKIVAAIRRYMEAARLPRGRDADAAADPRRRDRAAVRDAPQRARHAAVPAHRARALPQAPARGRLRARLRDQPLVPQRGHERLATTPSSRCSRRIRRSATWSR